MSSASLTPLARSVFSGSLALAAACAVAEPEHSGHWTARFATESGERQEAALVVDVSVGTWTLLPPAGRPPHDRCAGRRFPVTLRGSGSSTVTMSIEASKVDPACRGRTARLTVVDTDTLEGEFEDGSVLRLERAEGPK